MTDREDLPPYLGPKTTSLIGSGGLTTDDTVWGGESAQLDPNDAMALAYNAADALKPILLALIDFFPSDRSREVRLDAALSALIDHQHQTGRKNLLVDEEILILIGRAFHKNSYLPLSKQKTIANLCRAVAREHIFDKKKYSQDEQKGVVKRLRIKFENDKDRYASAGSVVNDYHTEERRIAIEKLSENLRMMIAEGGGVNG